MAPGQRGTGGLPQPRQIQHAVELRTYIVEDNATIRENLIGTLEELSSVRALGWAEGETAARAWMATHRGQWDLLIVDLFLKQGSGLGVIEACQDRGQDQRVVVLRATGCGCGVRQVERDRRAGRLLPRAQRASVVTPAALQSINLFFSA
jgi:response regulator RpfG family c-di-GMP phosphodiesterase